MVENVIQVVKLAREYKRGKIAVAGLDGVDLKVKKGEIIGIIGPSGSGKTTFLNLVGGLDRPTSGNVIIDEKDLNDLDDNQLADYRLRKIGFIFQFYNLIPTLTALENVMLPMTLANDIPKPEQEQRAIDLLKLVGLGDRVGHLPDELSGGEQQRVAVARAFANNPSVILADEPTGDLDSKSAKILMELIKRLQTEKEVTFVIVTHDPIVLPHCDKVYAFRDGRITREVPKGGKLSAEDRALMDSLF